MTTDWIVIGIIGLIGLILFVRWLIQQGKKNLEFAKYVTDQQLRKPTCPLCHSMLDVKVSNYKKSGTGYRQYLICPNCHHHVSVSHDGGKNASDLEHINQEINKDPNNAANWLAKGAVEEKLGQYAAARNSYENVIRLGWDNKVLDVQKMINQLKRKGY